MYLCDYIYIYHMYITYTYMWVYVSVYIFLFLCVGTGTGRPRHMCKGQKIIFGCCPCLSISFETRSLYYHCIKQDSRPMSFWDFSSLLLPFSCWMCWVYRYWNYRVQLLCVFWGIQFRIITLAYLGFTHWALSQISKSKAFNIYTILLHCSWTQIV